VLSQYTRLTDGQTDRQTDVDRKTVRMLRSRTVKINFHSLPFLPRCSYVGGKIRRRYPR